VDFEVLFGGIADYKDFGFPGEIGFERAGSFDCCFEFVAHKAHFAFY